MMWSKWFKRNEKNRRDDQFKIICLVGESGSGKTTLAQAMSKYGFTSIPSYTTRPARGAGDQSHLFIDKEAFDNIRPNLVAYQKFDAFEYGVTMEQLVAHHLFVVDPKGLEQVRYALGDDAVLAIYLSTSPSERIRRMAKTRGSDDALRRVDHDATYFYGFREYNVVLKNEIIADQAKNELILLGILERFYA